MPETFSDIPGWSELSGDPEVIGTNSLLAVLAVLTLLIATTVFNSTLEENSAELLAFVRKFPGSQKFAAIAAFLGWVPREELKTQKFWLSMLKPGLLVLMTASIYALLEPGVGFNNKTLLLATALTASIAMATFLYEGGQVFWSSRHYQTPAAVRIYPVAIVIAFGSVALTRITGLHPGLIFGFVAAAAIFPRTTLSSRADGIIILVPLVGLLLVSAVAFLLLDPLRQFSNDNPGVFAILPETIAAALFVTGAESALLILLPLSFNDGEKIWNWNKLVWFALALPATFAFFHTVINQGDFGELMGDTSDLTIVVTVVVVVAISFGTWTFFKLRKNRVTSG